MIQLYINKNSNSAECKWLEAELRERQREFNNTQNKLLKLC